MIDTSRRTFLGASAAFSLMSLGAGTAQAGGQGAASPMSAIEPDLKRYVDFGIKRAGGNGDMACGNWLAEELEKVGYTVERQTFSAPFFEADVAELRCGETVVPIYPQPIVVPTGAGGVSGPIVRVDAHGRAASSLTSGLNWRVCRAREWGFRICDPNTRH